MLAKDLAEQVPMVQRSSRALEAATIIASLRISGVVVAGADGEPIAVVPGSQLLSLVLPRYVRDNAALAHVYDEAGADEVCARLRERTVGELLDDEDVLTTGVPHVLPQDTLVEIAAVMVRQHAPVVVVRGNDGRSNGVVTVARLLAAVLAAAGGAGPAVERTLARDLLDVHRAGQDLGS